MNGRRIAITRAEEQGAVFAVQLREYGAVPLLCPAIAYAPPDDSTALDQALAALARYDWLVLTSAQAARVAFAQADLRDISIQIAAVGPATAQVIRDAGYTVNLVSAEHSAEGLLAAIGAVAGQRILLPAADIARSNLAEGLTARGATVDAVIAYRTVPGPGAATLAPLLQASTVDAVTFTSSSTVQYLLEGCIKLGITQTEAVRLLNHCVLACIGPQTAATARGYGLSVVEAETASTKGLIATLIHRFSTADECR